MQTVKIHPDQDCIVRVVTLNDKNKTYKRPVTEIVALPYVNDTALITSIHLF